MKQGYYITGKNDIVIRASSAFTVGNKTYNANDVIAFITEANVEIRYLTNTTTHSQGIKNLASLTQVSVNSVVISNIDRSDTLLGLLMRNNLAATPKIPVRWILESDSNGTIILPVTSDTILTDIQVYDTFKNKIISFTYNETSQILTGLTPETVYSVFVYMNKQLINAFTVQETSVPPLKLEILSTGNIDDRGVPYSGGSVVIIDKASLSTDPSSILDPSRINNLTLTFVVLSTGNVEIKYYA